MDVIETKQYSQYRDSPPSSSLPNVNCAPPTPIDHSDDSSNGSVSEGSDDDIQWKRQKKKKKSKERLPINRSSPANSEAFAASAKEFQSVMRCPPPPLTDSKHPARRNNVWCNVLSEQMLTEDIHGFGVQRTRDDDGRDIESYAYWRKHNMEEPPPKAVVETTSSNRRKRKKIPLMTFASDETDEKLGGRIANKLQEAKTHLIVNVVRELGKEKAVKLLQKTEEIERTGGLLTVRGNRRRTAGGVFFRVLKEDADVTRVQMDSIFAEERKEAEGKRKKLKAVARRKKFAKLKTVMKEQVAFAASQDFVPQNLASGDSSEDGKMCHSTGDDSRGLDEEELEPGEIVDDDDDMIA